MVNAFEFGESDAVQWREFKELMPSTLRAIAEQYPPNKLFLLKPFNRRVTVSGYADNGTLDVMITGEFNRIFFARNVRGVEPHELEECDFPHPSEKLGDLSAEWGMTPQDVVAKIVPLFKGKISEEILSQLEQETF
jgi:hypothetical protein